MDGGLGRSARRRAYAHRGQTSGTIIKRYLQWLRVCPNLYAMYLPDDHQAAGLVLAMGLALVFGQVLSQESMALQVIDAPEVAFSPARGWWEGLPGQHSQTMPAGLVRRRRHV